MVSTGNLPVTRGWRPLVSPATTVLMAEDGDVLRFDEAGARVADRVPAGRVLIDGTRTGEIVDEVLRDRKHLAGDGLVVPVVAINGQTGALEQPPGDHHPRSGGRPAQDAMLREAPRVLARAIEAGAARGADRSGLVEGDGSAVELQRMFRKRAGRRPLVLPVVMEV